jgi:hypothetical protein
MTEWHERERGPITEEKLLKAVHILAVLVEDQGPSFRPLYHDVRQQLVEFRQQQEGTASAKSVSGRKSMVA